MKQTQKMQEEMQKAQQKLNALEVEGQAGGGMVKVTMTGKHEVRKVLVEDGLLRDDKDMLEDLIAAAFNDASNKVEQMMKDQLSGLASGLNFPSGIKLPF